MKTVLVFVAALLLLQGELGPLRAHITAASIQHFPSMNWTLLPQLADITYFCSVAGSWVRTTGVGCLLDTNPAKRAAERADHSSRTNCEQLKAALGSCVHACPASSAALWQPQPGPISLGLCVAAAPHTLATFTVAQRNNYP